MNHRIKLSFVFPIGAWFLLLIMDGCASTQSGTYLTLRQTQIHVSWPMRRYRNVASFGGITLAERERTNAAYAEYQAAFDQALQAAGGNHDAPTPENVKARANELYAVLAGISL